MTGLEVITMQEGHLPSAIYIEGESFSPPWPGAFFREEMEKPLADACVAVKDGMVMGYFITEYIMDEGHLLKLAVHPGFRQRGVGRALAQKAIERLDAEGCKHVYIEVRDSNTLAREFYEKLGFRRTGRRKDYYTHPCEDAAIMSLAL